MNKQTSCEMIRDLLPLYAEQLTSPETEKEIREHLASCPACREFYEEMTAPEPVRTETIPEVDGLKMVKKRRLLTVAAAVLAVALIGVGLYAWFSARAKAPVVSYDAEAKTLVICGSSGYDRLSLPAQADEALNADVQDDNFRLSLYLPVLRGFGESVQSYLPAYLERTDKSLAFLRDYLRANAPEQGSTALADKSVEFTIRKSDTEYSYDNSPEDRISIELGSFYWHREELYLLALMNTEKVTWQQLGYAWYLGNCVDPYNEQQYTQSEAVNAEQPYYEAFLRIGGDPALSTPQDQKLLMDAISWACLTQGQRWGTAYETSPVSNTLLFRGGSLSKANSMSVCMATSFIAWLSERCGFDKVTAFCFDACSFEEAFQTDFDSAWQSWSEWILTSCGP